MQNTPINKLLFLLEGSLCNRKTPLFYTHLESSISFIRNLKYSLKVLEPEVGINFLEGYLFLNDKNNQYY